MFLGHHHVGQAVVLGIKGFAPDRVVKPRVGKLAGDLNVDPRCRPLWQDRVAVGINYSTRANATRPTLLGQQLVADVSDAQTLGLTERIVQLFGDHTPTV